MYILTCNPSNLVYVSNFLTSSSGSFWNRLSIYISIICEESAKNWKKSQIFSRKSFWRFWNAIIFSESNDDTAVLKRRVLQTALWHYNLLKLHLQNISCYTNNSKMPNFELWQSCGKWVICFVRDWLYFIYLCKKKTPWRRSKKVRNM